MSDFKDNTFAFINADQVIEHAKYPEIALKEWVRILKIGGVLNLNWPAGLKKISNLEGIEKFKPLEEAFLVGNLLTYLDFLKY